MSKHKKRKRPANRATSARAKAVHLAGLIEQGKEFRWAPGQSGNRKGRPPAVFSQACRAKLAELVPGDPLQRSYAQYFADMLAHKGMHGDQGAVAELVDRSEGRPRVGLDLGTGDDPLTRLCEEMAKMSEKIGPPEGQERDNENKTKEQIQ